jgi:hypothetical protein
MCLPIDVGRTSTNKLSDLQKSMEIYVSWFQSHSAQKWTHQCSKCHQLGMDGLVILAAVCDRKVMGKYFFQLTMMTTKVQKTGHQICKVPSFTTHILSAQDGFCEEHIHYLNICPLHDCDNACKKGSCPCHLAQHQQLISNAAMPH